MAKAHNSDVRGCALDAFLTGNQIRTSLLCAQLPSSRSQLRKAES